MHLSPGKYLQIFVFDTSHGTYKAPPKFAKLNKETGEVLTLQTELKH